MFNHTLRTLRESKNMTQEDLAKAIGVTAGSIGNYEQGTRMPRNKIMKKLATFFNVSIDYLLGLEETKIESTTLAYSGNDKVNSIIKLILNSDISDNDLHIIEAVLDKYKR